jgi:hypothetical protein
MRRFAISRRTLLRGVGATLALPWLEIMSGRTARCATGSEASTWPTRFAALYMPNGVRDDTWTPSGEGTKFELSPTLSPLENVKNELLIPTNLWNAASNYGDGHYVKTSGWLTCTTITKSVGIDISCNGVSLDQVIARHNAGSTPIASMELAIDPVSSGVDTNVGYTRVYGSHIAWAGPTQPLPREINPRLAFERLFRAGQPRTAGDVQELALLDRVLQDADSLRKQLGAADRRRMDDYLESVRALEKRIQDREQGTQTWKPLVPLDRQRQPPAGIPSTHAEHVRMMLDIIALAFQSDTTRVCTFMFGNSVSGKSFSFLDGVTGGHHDQSHHQGDEDKLRQYELITRWHIEQYAYLLGRLRDMQEGESNVLRNSMILLGNEIRDGNRHSPHNLPLLLGGRGGGRIATGQHLVFPEDTPLSNLYLCLLEASGLAQERFADSTGPLPGVLLT